MVDCIWCILSIFSYRSSWHAIISSCPGHRGCLSHKLTGSTLRRGVARLVGGWGALAQRTSPTCQAGLDPAWWVGEVRKPSATHPPTAQATPRRGVLPTHQVGRDQLTLSHKPTAGARDPLSVYD